MNKTIIGIIVIVIVVVGLFFVLTSKKSEAPEITLPAENTNVVTQGMPVPEESNTPETIVVETAPTPAVKEFTITGKNFSFTPSTITVKKGDRVKITFKNTQGMHNFIIDEFGVATPQAQAPDTEVLEFTANKTGSFEYYCSVGTHRAMGMKGTLVVE